MDPNSMLLWWPRVKDLDIPMPKTEIVEVDFTEHMDQIYEEDFSSVLFYKDQVIDFARSLGFPVFLRTDLTSGKHSWKDTCYVEKEEDVTQHMGNLLYESISAGLLGLSVNAFVLREFVKMDSRFTNFIGDMPVNSERRYFIRDGKVECRHPYWIEDAIESGAKMVKPENWRELVQEQGLDPESLDGRMACFELMVPELPNNWRYLLQQINTETAGEVKLLTGYAEQIAQKVEGYWSVDFCKAKDGRWIFIDMATGNMSWHPEDCEFYLK